MVNASTYLTKLLDLETLVAYEQSTGTNLNLIPGQESQIYSYAVSLSNALFSTHAASVTSATSTPATYSVVYGTSGDDVVNLSYGFIGGGGIPLDG